MYDGVFCFEAEDGIRDDLVTGVQTCALPISNVVERATGSHYWSDRHPASVGICEVIGEDDVARGPKSRGSAVGLPRDRLGHRLRRRNGAGRTADLKRVRLIAEFAARTVDVDQVRASI